MMTFKQRLKFYGFGFVLGAIILVMILSKKKCRGMNEMKVVELVSQTRIVSPKAQCKLKALGLSGDTAFIYAMKNFRVNYALSDIHRKPCGIYKLEPQNPDSAMFNITICDCDTVSTIDDIDVFPKYKVNCDTVK
jgi:hypothetical protein